MLAWIIHTPLIVLLLLYLAKRSRHTPLKVYFWPAAIYKILAGITLGLIYFYYYQHGDTLAINQELHAFSQICKENFSDYLNLLLSGETNNRYQALLNFYEQPRIHFFNRIASPLFLFSLNNYWITATYLSIFSFAGFWYFGEIIYKIYKVDPLAIAIALLFMPGIALWTSGLLKESLVTSSLFFSTAIILGYTEKLYPIRAPKLILACMLLFIAFHIKFYYTAVLLAVLPAYVISKKITGDNLTWKSLLPFLGFLITLLLILSHSNAYLNISTLAESIYNNYTATLQASGGSNIFIFENLQPTLSSMGKHSPQALFNGLFRPLPLDIHHWIAIPAAIENIFILTFTLTALFAYYKNKPQLPAVVLPALAFVILSATLITLASPNWGTLYRYKSPYMSVFLIMILNRNPLLLKIKQKLNYLWEQNH
ncbi:hypothetical protein RCC89_01150 [Cytophagaceae bacterium ABcell3]|nr:hypothetical protein RCC89_01150 [Cytophagaceae bacterium ABcell3]